MNTNYDAKEKIFLLLYKKPMIKDEIITELYDTRNTRVYTYVNELKKKGWITIIQDINDGKRNICYPNAKAIIDSISQDIDLNPGEIKRLEVFLSKPVVIQFIKNIINNIGFEKMSFDKLKDIIGYFSVYVFLFTRYYSIKAKCSPGNALRKIKKTKSKDIDKLKKSIVSSFNDFSPISYGVNADKIKNSYMEYFFEFIHSVNNDLLLKLCRLSDNAEGYFLLGSSLFSFQKVVDSLIK